MEGGTLWTPCRSLLIANAIVHGIAQHGLAPHSYPLLRMVSDLIDLGAATAPMGDESMSLIATDVSPEEANAALAPAGRLAAGDAALFNPAASSPETLLLQHVVGAVVDKRYAQSLKLAYLMRPLCEGSRTLAVLRGLRDILFLSERQLERLEGPPHPLLGRLPQRLARPFRLIGRWIRG